MMLTELYRYALKNNLAARPGFSLKAIKAYISLSADGKFIAIDPGPEEKILCPDIGSLINGPRCNILVEKATYSLTKENPNKHAFFLDALRSGSGAEPMFAVVLKALETPETVEAIISAIKSSGKYKMSEAIGFKVDGKPVERSTRYYDWWDEFRARLALKSTAGMKLCMITGNLTEPIATVKKVSGLQPVGGHPSGDALLCFDKSAFQSYELKQAQNAPVSEEAMAAVNSALNELIAKAPKLSGAKWIHWYQSPVRPEEDLLELIISRRGERETEEEEQTDDDLTVNVQLALNAADRLVESAKNGEYPERLTNRYYLLSLSGASGRIMVRSWSQGSYEELYESVKSWFDDLRLILPSGKGMCKPPKLFALNVRLLIIQKNSKKKLSERMAEELSAVEPQIIQSIVNNTPLPDTIAARALQYIRSDMLTSTEDDKGSREVYPDPLACQWLKIWLLRKQKGGIETVKEELYLESPSIAYHMGRMIAVFADIQARAMGPDLKTGVIQRYYAAACTSPALVIGQLSRLSQHHLAKIENRYLKEWYLSLLGEISEKIGNNVPTTLTLEQQSEFALGYYQQRAAIVAERTASKETQKETKKEEA